MATLGLSVANDIANQALILHLRGQALAQTIQDKPLLKWLRDNSKTFASGNLQVSEPVQGTFMSDTAGFLQGITEDDAVLFAQAQNVLRATYTWKEVITGLIITWTELLKDGITVTDDGDTQQHSDVALTRLASILESRLSDFGESNSRAMNRMFWQDGTQDAKQIPGILSFFNTTPAVGTVGGLNKGTYAWWRQQYTAGLAASAQNSDLIQFFNTELIQLKRYGGKPDKALCGSDFLAALRTEVVAKGSLTMNNWQKPGSTEIGINTISINGLGTFEYDPTLDDLGMAKSCFIMDSRRLKYRPMEKEDMRVIKPERPYNYLVFLQNVKSTGVLVCNQLNAHGRYSIA